MKTVQIQCNLFRVAIHAGKFTEYTAQDRLVTQPDDAEFYDEEDADILVETYQAMYPLATVQKEVVEETMTIDALAETIADTYNTLGRGWDFQHCNQSRSYGEVSDMCNTLDNHEFTADDIKPAIDRDIDTVNELNDVMTITEWCEFVADSVAKKITNNQYGDVTFIITLKK